jgi:hypothetical protein
MNIPPPPPQHERRVYRPDEPIPHVVRTGVTYSNPRPADPLGVNTAGSNDHINIRELMRSRGVGL